MGEDDTPTRGNHDEETAAETAAGSPVWGTGDAGAAPSGLSYMPGDTIGRYTIRETLGEGGMGAVYLAEQSTPVTRRVALKVIKPGMDSASVVARFEAERQALAVMDHPCIARVLDGGTTARGLPYFVMEHVKGLPITEHCDRYKLDLEARLRLFVRVSEAVQHAHGKGVIHRDLKPGNILVSYQGDDHTPKVIDFGIAKALGGKMGDATLHTELGAFVGTPDYMSPEQAGGVNEDVDTRSDIYALGVILYELLTGARPFDAETLKKAALFEIQRIIRDVDPPRPSTRLLEFSTGATGTKIAENRRTEIRSLSGVMKRDLDWVVMKCLEKDRARRYDTANALAMEIERFLRDEPVLAGPPSASYRLSKFVKRNRAGVIAAGVGVVLVLAGLAGTSAGLVEAKRQTELARRAADAEAEQRGLADRRADEAEAARLRAETAEAEATARAAELQLVADFQSEQLGGIEVEAMGAGIRNAILTGVPADQRATLTEALSPVNFTNIALETLEASIFNRTIAAIDTQFADQPLVRAQLLQSVAYVIKSLSISDLAFAPQSQALRIRRAELGDDHLDTLYSVYRMASLLRQMGRFGEAEILYREALQGRRRVLGDDHPLTIYSLNSMYAVLIDQGHLDEAESFVREALDRSRRALGDEHRYTMISIQNLAYCLLLRGRLEESRLLTQEAMDTSRRLFGDDHLDTLRYTRDMGDVTRMLGNLRESEPFLRQAIDGFRRTLGDDHPYTIKSIKIMTLLLNEAGRYREGEPFAREYLARSRRVFTGDERWRVAEAESLLGEAISGQARFAEAEPILLGSYETLNASLSDVWRAQLLPAAAARLVALYDAWHAAEPGAGHDLSATLWRAKSGDEPGE